MRVQGLIFMVVMAALTATAEPLTPQQALQRASARPSSSRVIAASSPRLAYTATLGGSPTVYVFNKPEGGFMILSADSATPRAMLGYSDNGTFDPQNCAPALREILDTYSGEVARAARSRVTARDFVPVDTFAAIAPMVSAAWGQGDPYNVMCPELNGQRCLTGCVATAMAQVMYYHKWPERGTGSRSFTWQGQTLSMDFSQARFDWDNMLDSYTRAPDSTQINAVALLMKACAYSVSMNFGPSASGASTLQAGFALMDYFDYNPDIYSITRDYYTEEAFEDSIYANLRDYGPVLFSGHNSDEGHAFVCDGYAGDGFFHINWGWTAIDDGYFLLSSLSNKREWNTDPNDSGYNFSQSAIMRIRPRREGDTPGLPVLNSPTSLSFPSSKTDANREASFRISISYNQRTQHKVVPTLRICHGDSIVGYATPLNSPFNIYYGFYYYNREFHFRLPDGLAPGKYLVEPVIAMVDDGGTPTGQYAGMNVLTGIDCATMNVFASGQATFQLKAPAVPAISKPKLNIDTIFSGLEFRARAELTGPAESDYYGTIYGAIMSADCDSTVKVLDPVYISIGAGETEPLSYAAFAPDTLGVFNFVFATTNTYGLVDRILSTPVQVTVAQSPTGTLSISPVRFNGHASAPIDDPVLLPAHSVEARISAVCTEGSVYTPFRICIMKETAPSTWSEAAVMASEPRFVSAGDTIDITLKIDDSAATPGRIYAAMVEANGSPSMSQWSYFRIYDSTVAGAIELGDVYFTDPATDPVYNIPSVEAENIRANIDVTATAGGILDPLTLTVVRLPEAASSQAARIVDNAAAEVVGTWQSEPLNMVAGDTKTVHFNVALPAIGQPTRYAAYVSRGDNEQSDPVAFVAASQLTTLPAALTTAADGKTHFYNLLGAEVPSTSRGVLLRQGSDGVAKIVRIQ